MLDCHIRVADGLYLTLTILFPDFEARSLYCRKILR